MANGAYKFGMDEILTGGIDISAATIGIILIDAADYVVDLLDADLTDVPAGARVATATLASKTVLDGVFDAADVVFSSVTGDQCEALIIHIDNGGAEIDDTLLFYLDDAVSGLPVTPDGSDITITFGAHIVDYLA